MRDGFSYLPLTPITFVCLLDWLIVLGFNDVPTLVAHFVSSPRERKERERNDSRRKKGTGKKEEWKLRNGRNKNIPLYPYLRHDMDNTSWQTVSQYQYRTSSPHPTTPVCLFLLEFNGPVNNILVISSCSVYLTTLLGQAYT